MDVPWRALEPPPFFPNFSTRDLLSGDVHEVDDRTTQEDRGRRDFSPQGLGLGGEDAKNVGGEHVMTRYDMLNMI